MGKHNTDPVLEQLVRAVNESGQSTVPVTVSAHGTVVTGVLIAQDTYFTELAEGRPLLSALRPATGLLGKDYKKNVADRSGNHLHIRAAGADSGLWRVSLGAVDGWTVGAVVGDEADKGPFSRLLGV